MQRVQINDQLYKRAERRAMEGGFSTVDEYVADVLRQSVNDDSENVDHLFTPDVIAHLDEISDGIKAGGKTYTLDEVKEHFEKKRTEWLQDHSG